jgi:hypothetical protein
MKSEYANNSLGGFDRLSNVQDPAPPQSAIDYAHEVLESARELANRIEALQDRLLGPSPTEASAGGILKAPEGVLPTLEEHARAVSIRITQAVYSMGCTERAL